MGIRFQCPNGHSLNVKQFLAGKRGICPECSARFIVPQQSGGRAEAVDVADSVVPTTSADITPDPDPIERTPLMQDPLLAELEISVIPDRPVRRRHRSRSLTVALSALVVLLAVVLVVVVMSQT